MKSASASPFQVAFCKAFLQTRRTLDGDVLEARTRDAIICVKHWSKLVSGDKYFPPYLVELVAIDCQIQQSKAARKANVSSMFYDILLRLACAQDSSQGLRIDFTDRAECKYRRADLCRGLGEDRKAPSLADPGDPTNNVALPSRRTHLIDWQFWQKKARETLQSMDS